VYHKVIIFILTMILSILITRLFVSVHNFNPILFNFELHHFDYGLSHLLVISLLLLFGKKTNNVCLILAAIAIGLIVEDYWFIRRSVVENHAFQVSLYNSTFPVALVFLIFAILIIFFINSIRKNKSSKP
jgi:hypothetical protein